MVIYSDLLTRALGKGDETDRADDLLLADVVDSRVRLHVTGVAAPVAEVLARELSYDGALIKLCESLDVRAAPAWFDCPRRERARLEYELLRGAFCCPHCTFRTPDPAQAASPAPRLGCAVPPPR